MSRIGNLPVAIPAGVEAKVNGNVVDIKGPNGHLSQTLSNEMLITLEGDEIIVKRPSNLPQYRSLHGLTRSLIENMVIGVTEGYSKELEVQGVGYRVAMEGNNLVMNLGFSHQVIIEAEEGITIEAPSANKIIVKGADKQRVGHVAAHIRDQRPPEPYKGKGIRYVGEYVIRKEGKAGKV